jgi:hypothetical protein
MIMAYALSQSGYITSLIKNQPLATLTDEKMMRQFRYARIGALVGIPLATIVAEPLAMAGMPYTASALQAIGASAIGFGYLASTGSVKAPHGLYTVVGAGIAAIGMTLSTAIAEALGQQKLAQALSAVTTLSSTGLMIGLMMRSIAVSIVGAIIGAVVGAAVYFISWLFEKPKDLHSIADRIQPPGSERTD